MAQQWIRAGSITAAGVNIVMGGNEDLRVRFRIESASSQTPNKAEVTITNLSAPTANAILGAGEGKTLQVDAGYRSNAGTIFIGNIVQVRRGRESPTDTMLIVNAAGGDQAYNHAVVNKALPKGSTAKDHFDEFAKSMGQYGVKPGHEPDWFSNFKYPRGVTFFGMARDYLRTLAQSHQCTWSIQNNTLDMVPLKESLPGGAVVLNAQTGMIGLPIQTEQAIIVKALINPQIKINGNIKLDNESIQLAAFATPLTDPNAEVSRPVMPNLPKDGLYKVMHAIWEGDSRGNDWYVTMTCLAANGPAGPLSSVEQEFGAFNAGNSGGYVPYQEGGG